MNPAIPASTGWVANLAIALMILLIGFMAGKLLGAIINRLLIEVQLDKALTGIKEAKFSPTKFITSIITTAIYIISFFLALDRLNITSIVLKIILIFIIIVIVGSIIFGLTTLLPNLYAGIIIKTNEKFKPGQKITVKNTIGKIERITLLRTKIISPDDDIVYVPNYVIGKSAKLI